MRRLETEKSNQEERKAIVREGEVLLLTYDDEGPASPLHMESKFVA